MLLFMNTHQEYHLEYNTNRTLMMPLECFRQAFHLKGSTVVI